MAKTLFGGNSSSFQDINKFLGNFDKSGALLSEYKTAEVQDWTHTGSYVLNACISGSLLRGVPSGRIITISGDPKSGKSYICLDMMRELQRKDYFCIYCDTENSTSTERFAAQGVDPAKVRVITPESINQLTVMFMQMTQSLLDTKAQNDIKNKKLPEDQQLKLPKIAIFIDSITALTSSKQMNDALAGELHTDMGGTAREIKQLFNMLTPRLGKLDIPMICTAHEYEADEGYQKVRRISGGRGATYMSSVLVSLRKRFEKDENRMKRGIIVTAAISESRFSVHRPVEFYISFTRGVNPYMGLQEFVSWDVCGIARGKMVNYTDYGQELISKKVVSSMDELRNGKFSTKDIMSILSIPKREAFSASVEYDLEKGFIKIINKDTTVVLPDLVTYLQSKGHNLNLEFDFNFLREKMTLDGIYSNDGITKLLSSYLESNDMFVIGNAKLDINKNQKFKFKKPCLEAINGGTYQEREIEVEVASDDSRYNEKIDQLICFNPSYFDREKAPEKVCMPTPTGQEWVVRHLGRSVKDGEFFNRAVFNQEVLEQLDEKIIVPAFSYRSSYEDMDGTLTEEDLENATGEEAVSDYDSIMGDIIGSSK